MSTKETDTTPAIKTTDLRVDYGETVAVKSLNLTVPRGEIYGLVGPNGAGKTSTFKVLSTLMEPTYGEVQLCGIDALLHPREVRHQLAYMPDLAPLPSDLRCGEFLEMFAAAHGLRGREKSDRINECLEAVELIDKRKELCKSLSRGMTQRLVLAKSLLHRPQLMILDEPASGMDPIARAGLRRSLRKIAEEGRTVIVSSHILTELADMCTSVGLMNKGELVDSGPVKEVIDRMSSQQRVIAVRLLEGIEKAESLLKETDHVGALNVKTSEKIIEFPFDGDWDAQADLMTRMIQEGCRLRSFSEQQSTIEDIFIALSESNDREEKAE